MADLSKGSSTSQIFYIHVDNLSALRADLVVRGLEPTELRVTHYEMTEFELRDPDGYWLRFGEDTDEAPTEADRRPQRISGPE